MINVIVSLYNPDESVVDHVKGFANQADRIVLCDNSADDHSAMFEGLPSVLYTTELVNLGLSAAFNRVLKDDQYQWTDDDYVVFFDQDSSIGQNHIQLLIEDYESLEEAGYQVGGIGPAFFNSSRGTVEEPRIKKDITANIYQVADTITSSFLTKYQTLKKVGFFNDRVFLDFVDWDLCWRLSASGLGIFMTRSTILQHTLGQGEKKFGPIRLRVGAPIREYYETRDALYLLRKPYVPTKMKLRLWSNVHIRPMAHKIFLDDWSARSHYIKRGKIDFYKEIFGRYIDDQ